MNNTTTLSCINFSNHVNNYLCFLSQQRPELQQRIHALRQRIPDDIFTSSVTWHQWSTAASSFAPPALATLITEKLALFSIIDSIEQNNTPRLLHLAEILITEKQVSPLFKTSKGLLLEIIFQVNLSRNLKQQWLQKALGEGYAINQTNEQGQTLLGQACERGDIESVNLLVEKGAVFTCTSWFEVLLNSMIIKGVFNIFENFMQIFIIIPHFPIEPIKFFTNQSILKILSKFKKQEIELITEKINNIFNIDKQIIYDLLIVKKLLKNSSCFTAYFVQNISRRLNTSLAKLTLLGFSLTNEEKAKFANILKDKKLRLEATKEWLNILEMIPISTHLFTVPSYAPTYFSLSSARLIVEKDKKEALVDKIFYLVLHNHQRIAYPSIFTYGAALDKFSFLNHNDFSLSPYSTSQVYLSAAQFRETLQQLSLTFQEFTPAMAHLIKDKLTQFQDALKFAMTWDILKNTPIDLKESILLSIINRITTMRVGEYILIPYGCLQHATLLGFEKTGTDEGSLTLYNSGQGVSNHPHLENTEKHQTFLTFEKVPLSNLLDYEMWNHALSNTLSQSVQEMYEAFTRMAKGGIPLQPSNSSYDYEQIQQGPTCATQCFMSAFRHQLMQHPSVLDLEKIGIYKWIKAAFLQSFLIVHMHHIRKEIQSLAKLKLKKTYGEMNLLDAATDNQSFLYESYTITGLAQKITNNLNGEFETINKSLPKITKYTLFAKFQILRRLHTCLAQTPNSQLLLEAELDSIKGIDWTYLRAQWDKINHNQRFEQKQNASTSTGGT